MKEEEAIAQLKKLRGIVSSSTCLNLTYISMTEFARFTQEARLPNGLVINSSAKVHLQTFSRICFCFTDTGLAGVPVYALYGSTEAGCITHSNNPEREPSDWVYVEFSKQCNAQFIPQHDDEGSYELIFVVCGYISLIQYVLRRVFGIVGVCGTQAFCVELRVAGTTCIRDQGPVGASPDEERALEAVRISLTYCLLFNCL